MDQGNDLRVYTWRIEYYPRRVSYKWHAYVQKNGIYIEHHFASTRWGAKHLVNRAIRLEEKAVRLAEKNQLTYGQVIKGDDDEITVGNWFDLNSSEPGEL